MHPRTAVLSFLAGLLLGLGAAAAQDQLPNPNAELNGLFSEDAVIDKILRSAQEPAAAGRKAEAIAEYKRVLVLRSDNSDAIAGLKALGASLLPELKTSRGKPSDA